MEVFDKEDDENWRILYLHDFPGRFSSLKTDLSEFYGKWKNAVIIESLLCFYNFNGTGYHYQDMRLNMKPENGLETIDEVEADLDGYINFAGNGPFHYIYKFKGIRKGYVLLYHNWEGGQHTTDIVICWDYDICDECYKISNICDKCKLKPDCLECEESHIDSIILVCDNCDKNFDDQFCSEKCAKKYSDQHYCKEC